jgi:phosphatidylglycerophosphatase A
MPGTAASIIGVLIFLLCKDSLPGYIVVTLGVILAGALVSRKAERLFSKKDAPCIVIDEVAGMLVSLFLIPARPTLIIVAFILFRVMDILKPYPINLLQRLPGGAGVMCDDLLAALYANLMLQSFLSITSFIAS